MKIVLSPMGSAGDIRPFIALGDSLKKLSCEVLMIVPTNGENLCKVYKLPYKTIDFDYKAAASTIGKKLTISEKTEMLDSELKAQFDGLAQYSKDAQFLIGSARNYAAQSVSELYNIPYYLVWHIVQVFKSKEHPPWRIQSQNNPAWINKLFWSLNDMKDNAIGRGYINKYREKLGLNSHEEYSKIFQKNIILSVDRNFARVPLDVKQEHIRTDYWHLIEETELEKGLLDFISAGEPTVYFGFGSMPDQTSKETLAIIEDIVEKLNIRAVVQCGWAGLGENITNNKIRIIDEVSHYRLFPRMAAVIHHGGSGTTHTAAMSGVPQIIIPQLYDQFYWANHVFKSGLGPKYIEKAKLNKYSLERAIEEAVNSGIIKDNAKKMSEVLKTRDSMEKIAEQLIGIFKDKIRIK